MLGRTASRVGQRRPERRTSNSSDDVKTVLNERALPPVVLLCSLESKRVGNGRMGEAEIEPC
jgi:hypothetical protein